MYHSALPVQNQKQKAEKALDQNPSTRKHRSALPVQSQKSKTAPDQNTTPKKHRQVPTAHHAKASQVRAPDQNPPAKKPHSRDPQHQHHHRKGETKHDTKPIDDIYQHLKKVHVQKGYSKEAAREIAYMESKKVVDKMKRTFRHEMKKYEK